MQRFRWGISPNPLRLCATMFLELIVAATAFNPSASVLQSPSLDKWRHLHRQVPEVQCPGRHSPPTSMAEDQRPRGSWSSLEQGGRDVQVVVKRCRGHTGGNRNASMRFLYTACACADGSPQNSVQSNVLVPASVHLRPVQEDAWLQENDYEEIAKVGGFVEKAPTGPADDLQPTPLDMEKPQLEQLEELVKTYPEEFVVKQYNVLAARMGNNMMPWMLQGAGVSRERREAIWQRFLKCDRAWKDELTEEQWRQVREWDNRVFNWSSRKMLLLNEMFADSPDILTLQELDKYKVFFQPAFRERGYNHVYAQRVNREDGIAIVFNSSRFQLLDRSPTFYLPNEHDDIPFHQPGSGITVSEEVKQVILHKCQNLRQKKGYGELGCRIALFALLRDRANPRCKIMIGSTHLDKSPDNPLKSLSRFNQMSVINMIQGELSKSWKVSLDHDVIIFGGDLNTDKQESTMVRQPALAGADYRLTKMSIQPCAESCTTLTEDRKMWIDYIFHAGQAAVTDASPPYRPQDPMPNLNQPSDHFSLTAKFKWMNSAKTALSHHFTLPNDYDYSWSTEDNYVASPGDEKHFGKYVEFRKMIDYTYHRFYRKERQLLQDSIVTEFLHHPVTVRDSFINITCETPVNNWVVYTAGCMGAGKSHTMKWLQNNSYFPLDSFVYVDPDRIRYRLPEMKRYVEIDANTSGLLTHKESGLIAEILTKAALQQGKNILIDGSLRDSEWNLKQFKEFNRSGKKIAIIHVHASRATENERAARRAKTTGRVVPQDKMQETAELLPKSLEILRPHANFFASIENEGPEPRLVEPYNRTWEDFSEVWQMECLINFPPSNLAADAVVETSSMQAR